MSEGFSLSGLEAVAAGQDSPRRDAILVALTNQYVELEPRLSDRHIELYDNVFRVLVNGIELQARLALSEKLAPMKRAPRETVRELANDEYAVVAAPVIQLSPVLGEGDLIAIARKHGEAHRAAVAGRPGIATPVTDVLVEHREQSVMVALIGNDTARLSPGGADVLTESALANPVVAQALAARLQLPAMAVTQILQAARSAVINSLAYAEPEAKAGDITAAVGTAVGVVASLPQKDAALSQDHVVTLYSMDSIDEVVAGLAAASSLSPLSVEAALEAEGADAMLIVLKAAEFSRSNVEAMLSIKLGIPVGWSALQEPLAQFDRISASDAERKLQYVLARQSKRVAR